MENTSPWPALHMYLNWLHSQQVIPDAFAADLNYLLAPVWDRFPRQEPVYDEPDACAPQSVSASLKPWQQQLLRLRLDKLHADTRAYISPAWDELCLAPGAVGEAQAWERNLGLYLDALSGNITGEVIAAAVPGIHPHAPLAEIIPAAWLLGHPEVYPAFSQAYPAQVAALVDALFDLKVPFIDTHTLPRHFPPPAAEAWGQIRLRFQQSLYDPGSSPDSLDLLLEEIDARTADLSGAGTEPVYAGPEIWRLGALMYAHVHYKVLTDLPRTRLSHSWLRALAQPEDNLSTETRQARFVFITQAAEQKLDFPAQVLLSVQEYLRPDTPLSQAIPALAAGRVLLLYNPGWDMQPPVPLETLHSLLRLSRAMEILPLQADLW